MAHSDRLLSLAQQPFALLRAMEARARSADHDVQRSRTEWVGVGVRIDEFRYVIPQDQVLEVLRTPATTRVPGSRRWMLGLSNVRGSLFPVIDVKMYCGDGQTVIGRDSRMVLLSDANAPVAIVVDEVFGFRRFPAKMTVMEGVEEWPLAKFVDGVFEQEEARWAVLDVLKLISMGGVAAPAQSMA